MATKHKARYGWHVRRKILFGDVGRLCGFGPGAVQNQRRCHVSKNIARNTCAYTYLTRCPRHHGARRTRHLPAQTHQRLIVSTLYHRHFSAFLKRSVGSWFFFLGGGSGLFKVHKYLINLNKISVTNVAIYRRHWSTYCFLSHVWSCPSMSFVK